MIAYQLTLRKVSNMPEVGVRNLFRPSLAWHGINSGLQRLRHGINSGDQTLFRNHFGSLKDALKNQLRGKLALFDIKHVTLVDHLTAIKCNLPITIPNTND